MARTTPISSLAIVLCLTSACAAARAPRFAVTEPVGPPGSRVERQPVTGELVVYTADNRVDTGDTAHARHTPYTIASAAGDPVERVSNLAGPFGQDPQPVVLQPGRYLVRAWAINFGPVEVPVVVAAGRTTTLHLDGDSEPDGGEALANAVRLPDGQAIGPRAD